MPSRRRTRRRDDSHGTIWDFLLGLGLGAIGYTILSALTPASCPACREKIDKGITKCPYCEVELEWK